MKWTSEYILQRFGIEVSEPEIDRLNVFLQEIAEFPSGIPPDDLSLNVLMHVWFLFIRETDEHLQS